MGLGFNRRFHYKFVFQTKIPQRRPLGKEADQQPGAPPAFTRVLGSSEGPEKGGASEPSCGPEPEESRTRGAGRKRVLTGQSWPSLNKK